MKQKKRNFAKANYNEREKWIYNKIVRSIMDECLEEEKYLIENSSYIFLSAIVQGVPALIMRRFYPTFFTYSIT